MPVSMEFSIARRKVVSAISACWACCRRCDWRQLAISIQVVMAASTATSQNSVPPTTPCDVRQACARSTRPLPTGETGMSNSLTLPLQGSRSDRPGRSGMLWPASSWSLPSNSATAYLASTSAGTP